MNLIEKNQSVKGYMTVEAAYVMPIVLFLYVLILTAAFSLYDRCVTSQDFYVLALRGSRFTVADENYGEVIYGNRQETDGIRSYLTDRLNRRRSYSFYRRKEAAKIKTEGNTVCIFSSGTSGALFMKKEAERINPVENLKEKGR